MKMQLNYHTLISILFQRARECHTKHRTEMEPFHTGVIQLNSDQVNLILITLLSMLGIAV